MLISWPADHEATELAVLRTPYLLCFAAELDFGLTRHRRPWIGKFSWEGLEAFLSALSGGAVSHPSTRVLIGATRKKR